jgi:hypothetical protein
LELDKEMEGVAKPISETQVIGVPRMPFQHATIELDEEMEDVEKIGGTSTQPKTSRQPKISPTLLPTLRSWNLGQPHPWNLILSPRKHIPTK